MSEEEDDCISTDAIPVAQTEEMYNLGKFNAENQDLADPTFTVGPVLPM